jgi:hypothetical protein
MPGMQEWEALSAEERTALLERHVPLLSKLDIDGPYGDRARGASNGPTEAINLLIEMHRRGAHGLSAVRLSQLSQLPAATTPHMPSGRAA